MVKIRIESLVSSLFIHSLYITVGYKFKNIKILKVLRLQNQKN